MASRASIKQLNCSGEPVTARSLASSRGPGRQIVAAGNINTKGEEAVGPLQVTDPSAKQAARFRPVSGSGGPRVSNDLAVRAKTLDFDLLAAEFVPDRLDVVRANLLQPDFLDDPRRLVDQRVLGSLDDPHRAVRPIDFAHESRIGNRLAQHFRMLLVERDVLSDFALGNEPPNAGPTRFVHFLADFQVLLCEAQDIGLRSGELGRDGNLLLVCQREGGKFLLDRLDMRSRSDA